VAIAQKGGTVLEGELHLDPNREEKYTRGKDKRLGKEEKIPA